MNRSERGVAWAPSNAALVAAHATAPVQRMREVAPAVSPVPHPSPRSARGHSAALANAADRLARNRQAIVEQVMHPWTRPERGESRRGLTRLGEAVNVWWRAQPAHLGLELATPLVSRYAGRHPWQFLAGAAAAGALVAVTRPWRLLSVSGVLIAVAKSSRLSSLLLPALAAVGWAQPGAPWRTIDRT